MIDPQPLHRPRVSRETRRLLATALLAVIALWGLGRLRYPDRPATPSVPGLLTQLSARPTLADLAADSAELRQRLGATLLPVQQNGSTVAAFRIRDDTAIAILPPLDAHASSGVSAASVSRSAAAGGEAETTAPEPIVRDAATGLTVLRVGASAVPLSPEPWTPRTLDEPQFLMATVASPGTVALRPVFIASLTPVTSPAWSEPIWSVAPAPDLQAGAIVFTENARLAGLVVAHEEGTAIVPGATLLADANRLREAPPRTPGVLGVEVQALTPSIAVATGAQHGAVVTRVDPEGPAARQLMTGDVIEAVDGHWLPTRTHWDVRAARIGAGDLVVLGVRRRGEWRDVQLIAARPSGEPLPLGLTLRRVAGLGSEVVNVDQPSAAAAAGIERGDLVTLVGAVTAPSPAQIEAMFDSATQPLLIAVSRGTTSRIATLHR